VTDPVLTVDRQPHPSGATVLAVSGELDHHTAPRLTLALDDMPFGPDADVVIDLSGLTYCDSTGITVLITADQRAREAGSRLLLAGTGADLLRVFRIVGLDHVLSFRPTLQDALETLSR
jgi:anti-sigma B factor antagonist